MKVRRIAQALPLVLVAGLSCTTSIWACEGLFAQRVKDRAPGHLFGSKYLTAIGDFDGDGCIDKAFFLERDGALPLLVCHGGDGRLTTLLRLESVEALDGHGVASLPRGNHRTLCGKGYGPDCGPGEPAETTFDHEAVEFLYLEKSSFLLFWTDGKWKKIWWSD